MSAPDPFAHQCCELIPLPMNNVAKRLGSGPGRVLFEGVAPHTGIDSSQGSAMVTPTPRRNLRLESWKRRAFTEAGFWLAFIGASPGPARGRLETGGW